MAAVASDQTEQSPPWRRRFWRFFCIAVVRAFYRRIEVQGREHLNFPGAMLICANHANALADALIIQAICPRMIHPLARSGLFANPLLRPFLRMIEAIPVFRRQDADAGASEPNRNAEAFARVYDAFARAAVVLIFPEGQSHSDPRLRPFKTGAARMVLGSRERDGATPALVPVGLNFTNKGKFRSSVFIEVGAPVDTGAVEGGASEENVRRLTAALEQALARVTLNVDAWEDLDLLRRIERFFAMRHGKYRRRNLAQRFRALRELIDAYRRLREREPALIAKLARRLERFEDQCRYWHIRDYHLTVNYSPGVVGRFLMRCVLIAFVIVPLGLYGLVNSFFPFLITYYLGNRLARSDDQYDTSKMITGLISFSLFWGAQTAAVYLQLGTRWALAYALSLLPAAAAAVLLRRQRRAILENIRVFLLFVRRGRLRRYLREQRAAIEKDLARLVRLTKQPHGTS